MEEKRKSTDSNTTSSTTNTELQQTLTESLLKFNSLTNTNSSDFMKKKQTVQSNEIEVDHHTNISHKPNVKDAKDLILEELSDYYETTISYNSDLAVTIARKYYFYAIVLFSLLNLLVKVIAVLFGHDVRVSLVFSFYRLVGVAVCFYGLLIFQNQKQSALLESNGNGGSNGIGSGSDGLGARSFVVGLTSGDGNSESNNQSYGESGSINNNNTNKATSNINNDENNILNNPFVNSHLYDFDRTKQIKAVDLLDRSLVDGKTVFSKWMIARILSLAISSTLGYIGVSNLKLEIYGLILLTIPIFTNIFSSLLLKEKFHVKYLIACLVCIYGGYYSLKPESNDTVNNEIPNNTLHSSHSLNTTNINTMNTNPINLNSNPNNYNTLLGVVCTFLSVQCIAIMNVSLKVLGREIDKYNLNYYSAAYSSVIVLVASVLYSPLTILLKLLHPGIIILSTLSGVLTAICYYLMFYAFAVSEMSKTTYINYAQLPLLAFIGAVVFNEYMRNNEIIGSVIIVVTLGVTTLFMK